MVATTSGTTSFSLDVDTLIRTALVPLGGGEVSGSQMEDYRVALNLILIKLQNKEIPLSKYGELTVPLVDGQQKYLLPENVIDVLQCVLRDDQLDLSIDRISLQDWNAFPKKDQKNRPTMYVTQRMRDQVDLTFWPVPNKEFEAKLLVSRKVEDITASYQKIDISTRYLPLLTAWLTYDLSFIRTGIPQDRINEARIRLGEVMPDTFEEDRERVDITMVPGGVCGR